MVEIEVKHCRVWLLGYCQWMEQPWLEGGIIGVNMVVYTVVLLATLQKSRQILDDCKV